MFYEIGETAICDCGFSDQVENLKFDAHLMCVRCPICNQLMTVIEVEREV